MPEKIFNDIKILYHRYNDKVEIHGESGAVILYNHQDLNPSRLGLFTGIKFTISDKVTLEIMNFTNNNVKYSIEKGYVVLWLDDNERYGYPVCKVKFVPKDKMFGVSKFYGHLIETT